MSEHGTADLTPPGAQAADGPAADPDPAAPPALAPAAPGFARSRPVDWNEATWLNPPATVTRLDNALVVTTQPNSDFWRTTSYGFINDNGHSLLTPLPVGSSVEVSFVPDFSNQFDQAGVVIRVDERTWIKAGVEFADGLPQLGAVVTREVSDWSTAPVPSWAGRAVTIRASRNGDAVTIRARRDEEPWQLVRLAPLSPDAEAGAGPFCASPGAQDLTVCFTRFVVGPPDAALH